jgi:hypothetical protein
MTFKFVNPAHSGTVQVTGTASTKGKAGGNGIYLDNLTISIINGSDGGSIINATGSGYMIATAIKNLLESQKPFRKGDKSNIITMTGTNTSPPPPTLTYTTQVEVDDPGQTKVLGE